MTKLLIFLQKWLNHDSIDILGLLKDWLKLSAVLWVLAAIVCVFLKGVPGLFTADFAAILMVIPIVIAMMFFILLGVGFVGMAIIGVCKTIAKSWKRLRGWLWGRH